MPAPLDGPWRPGQRVVKNPARWVASDFDGWGRGQGVGIIVQAPYDVSDVNMVDVRWPGGRCFEAVDQLLPAPPED